MSLPASTIGTIYGIRDDRDGLFRWVGRTTQRPISRRLYGHKACPDGTLYDWLTEARNHVSIHVLTHGDGAAERETIRRLHADGHPLLNKAHLHGWPRKITPREGVLRDRLCR